MGTRSRIGVMHGDVVKSVYCHWDGYLEHNGQILLEHYDSAKANNLVALGDLSSLGSVIGENIRSVSLMCLKPSESITTTGVNFTVAIVVRLALGGRWHIPSTSSLTSVKAVLLSITTS